MAAQVVTGNVLLRYNRDWSLYLRGRNVRNCQSDSGSLRERSGDRAICLLMDSSSIQCSSGACGS
jgi:hypothetical protein